MLQRVLDRLRGSQNARPKPGEPAVPGQVAPHLPQEERVTAGLIAQQRRRSPHLTIWGRALPGQVLGDVIGGERRQVQPPEHRPTGAGP